MTQTHPWYASLADDGLECTHTQFGMVWDRYGDRRIGKLLLHHDMAARFPSSRWETAGAWRQGKEALKPVTDTAQKNVGVPVIIRDDPVPCTSYEPVWAESVADSDRDYFG